MTPSVRVLTAPAARVARTGRGKALVCNAKQQHVTMVEVPTTPMQVRPLERTIRSFPSKRLGIRVGYC
jgi:hypothetical protein